MSVRAVVKRIGTLVGGLAIAAGLIGLAINDFNIGGARDRSDCQARESAILDVLESSDVLQLEGVEAMHAMAVSAVRALDKQEHREAFGQLVLALSAQAEYLRTGEFAAGTEAQQLINDLPDDLCA
jgi:hypothetical protein